MNQKNTTKVLLIMVVILAVLIAGYTHWSKKSDQNLPHEIPSISTDHKDIVLNNDIQLSVDDEAIFNWFKTESQLCDKYNINTTTTRKMFCDDKATFRNETRFKSIAPSEDGRKVGFVLETDELPDTAVGIFYPYEVTKRVSILSDYYLGNEFISFSPLGKNFVYKGGCFEGNCAFFIKDSETLKDIKLDFIPENADERGNYEFAGWITDNKIEYKLYGELKEASF